MKTKKLFWVTCLVLISTVFTGNAQQWNLTGNAGTDPATNYIGTSDAKPLIFKMNNTFSGSLTFAQLFGPGLGSVVSSGTSFGYNSLLNNTGNGSSAFGAYALYSNTSSTFNSAFGTASLISNTTGSYNTALGVYSMKANVNGNNNIAIGYNSLRANPSSTGNIAIGFESMGGSTGDSNIAIGYRAFNGSTASGNIGIGGGVLSNLVSPATFNVAVGQDAGLYLSTGNYNSFFGRSSGRGSTNFNTGSQNSFFGYDSGVSISSGNLNSVFGYSAGNNVTTGGGNSFFGNQSGKGITVGNNNTFVGFVDIPQSAKTSTSPGYDTSNTIILATGNSTQRLFIHENGFTGIGLGNNVIPKNTLEIRSLGGSPSASGLRFTNLLNTSASIANTTNKVLSVNATGDVILVDDKQGTGSGGGATTNVLTSTVNTMTSTVNDIVASTPIVNSVLNAVTSNQLTTTVNGVVSSPITLPSLTEVDGSVTNELSDLSLTGNVLTLTNPLTPGNSVILPLYSDNDAQTLTLSGNDLSISNGNTVTLPTFTEVDGSVTNELQTLSENPLQTTGTAITLSNGGGTVYVNGSETQIQAGTNITVTGSGTSGSPYVINSTATSGSADINIYKDNGTLTGNRTMFMNNNNLIFNSTSNTGGKIYIGNVTAFNAINFPITTGNYKLYVEGGVLTEKVKVALRSTVNWADYVFANDYKLMPLNEVETFIKANKHLPGVSSAENLVKEGLDLGAMQAKQMQKIEELTLYAIEQNKTIEKQSKEIEELKVLVNALVNKNK